MTSHSAYCHAVARARGCRKLSLLAVNNLRNLRAAGDAHDVPVLTAALLKLRADLAAAERRIADAVNEAAAVADAYLAAFPPADGVGWEVVQVGSGAQPPEFRFLPASAQEGSGTGPAEGHRGVEAVAEHGEPDATRREERPSMAGGSLCGAGRNAAAERRPGPDLVVGR